MEQYSLVKGYKDNDDLRSSFNQLAADTFGIQFEDWYQNGYWTEKYQPYSLIDNGKVVANVSVNLLTLFINGEQKSAVQIGTVMTHRDYRNKGLSRRLMEVVLEDYKKVDLIYLFANPSVLEFYPKFGFQAVEEVQFSQPFDYHSTAQGGVRKLDGKNPEDLALIYTFVSQRKPISRTFGTIRTEELFMFYCIMVFSQDLYYFEEENALVIFQIHDDTLHVYDVVSDGQVNMDSLLQQSASEDVKRVVFHYHPEENKKNLLKQTYQSKDVLFIKNQTNVKLPKSFKHPITSQA